MAKRRHHRGGGRTTPKGTRPADARRHHPSGEPALVDDARARLRESTPLGLLAMASSYVEATTTRPADRFRRDAEARPDGPRVFEVLARSEVSAVRAVALAVAALHPDELLARRLRTIVDSAPIAAAPRWLTDLDRIEITETLVQTEPLNDGEDIVITIRWPGGATAVAVVDVDHNVGALVKDAFVVEGTQDVLATMRRLGVEQQLTLAPIDPADARARLEQAITTGDMLMAPFESESWPMCRPLVEWIVRHLPAGGTPYPDVEPDGDEIDGLVDAFVRSSFGAIDGLDREDVRAIAEHLFWFAAESAVGDPLRWSPVSVEVVLVDRFPATVFDLGRRGLERVPDVLAAVVRFAHDRRSIPANLTTEALVAVRRWRGDYLAAMTNPSRSPYDSATRLARIAAGLDPDDEDDEGTEEDRAALASAIAAIGAQFERRAEARQHADELEAMLVRQLGSRDRYDALDDAPLVDIAFDWHGLADEGRRAVAYVLELVDRWAIELFDAEVRTIARAVLGAVVRADPTMVVRASRPEVLAAAVVQVASNESVMSWTKGAARRERLGWRVGTQQELAAATGVSTSTLSTRGKAVEAAVRRDGLEWAGLLHSSRRRDLLLTKQLIADMRAGLV